MTVRRLQEVTNDVTSPVLTIDDASGAIAAAGTAINTPGSSAAVTPANQVLAGPASAGPSAAAAPRALVAADIPSLSATYQPVSGKNTPGATGYPQLVAAPATATDPGVAGQIAYDATHIYVCVATNVWVRATLATF